MWLEACCHASYGFPLCWSFLIPLKILLQLFFWRCFFPTDDFSFFFFFPFFLHRHTFRNVLDWLCESIYVFMLSVLRKVGYDMQYLFRQSDIVKERTLLTKHHSVIIWDHHSFSLNGVASSKLTGDGSRCGLLLSGYLETFWSWFCASMENLSKMLVIIQFWTEHGSNGRWCWLGMW